MNKFIRCYPLLMIIAMIASLNGCGYGTVSPETYEIAKAIYGVCNRQQTEKLPQVTALIESSLTEQKITPQEAEWLHDLVRLAENGHWESAASKARQMLADQNK